MSSQNFADRLVAAINAKNSRVCVGLDPRLDQIPGSIISNAQDGKGPTLVAAAEAILNFNKGIIDAVHDLVPIVKPQVAFYEMFGFHGMWAYEETCAYARSKGLLVLADIKRSDIGSTAEVYAQSYLGTVDLFGSDSDVFEVDAVTVNPYMGYDSVEPFVKAASGSGNGLFVLVKTSNKTSGDIQDRVVDESGFKVHELVGQLTESWGADLVGESGYSSVGAVVGATYPHEIEKLRGLMPESFFLIPGYGAQGGVALDVKAAFDKDGLGAIVNSSRGIIFAYEKSGADADSYADAARDAVIAMNEDINSVIG